MRKFLLCLAALLPAFSGLSQEFSFVTRAEYSSAEDGHLGNSSIYFIADGNFTENLSYSAELHLLSSAPADLYTATFYSNTVNWLDWFDLTYDFGPLQLSAGKEIVSWGTFENQEYDFDVWYESASTVWLSGSDFALPSVYQWGAKVTLPIADFSDISIQATTSPYGERPFASGLFAYNAMLRCRADEEQGISTLSSFNLVQGVSGEFLKYGAASVRYIAGDWSFVLDNTLRFEDAFCSSHALSVTYSPLENLSFNARGGYEQGWWNYSIPEQLLDDADRIYGGLTAVWYPCEPLRVHALAAYDSLYEAPLFNVGVTWTISL